MVKGAAEHPSLGRAGCHRSWDAVGHRTGAKSVLAAMANKRAGWNFVAGSSVLDSEGETATAGIDPEVEYAGSVWFCDLVDAGTMFAGAV